jgi:hypothetical protein
MGMQGGKAIIFDSHLIQREMASHSTLCAIFVGMGGLEQEMAWHLLERA